mgnify:FL=1
MPGPMKRKKLYRHILKSLHDTGYFDDWRQTDEVCRKVNMDVPDRWSQLHGSALFRYMRELSVEERHIWRRTQMVRQWKKI